jgi:hypothetical protein
MEKDQNYYRQLLHQYLNNNCTPQQVEEVLQYLQQEGTGRLVLEHMQTEFDQAMELEQPVVPLHISQNLQRRLTEQIITQPIRPLYKRLLFRIAAAAILVILLGAGTYYLFFNHRKVQETAGTPVTTTQPTTLPGRNRPYITMANGRQLVLDSAGNGTLAQQGNTQIVQLADGQLTYRADSSSTTGNIPPTYNTLTVPKGGRMITLILADGTKVWINTGSSLKYPTVFASHERTVELTGEAYFEVTHNKDKPFAVHTPKVTVNVLGTSFNVSTYEDDERHEVVLVKGAVKLMKNERNESTGPKNVSRLLSPGQLASYSTITGSLAIVNVNTDVYTSWTKGYLIVQHTPWQQIVKKLSRHYDVAINTEEPAFKEETFSGRLDLHANLEDMMNLICTGTPFIYLPTERKLVRR